MSNPALRRCVVACAAVAALGLAPSLRAAGIDLDLLTFRASGPSPFAADCNGVAQTGTLFTNAEVEPYVAVNPRFPLNLIGVWQQDRWSNGGAQGLGTGVSFDGGITWKRLFVPFSRCAGGNAGNNGDWERATDPWVSFSPNGVAHQMALSFSDNVGPTDPASAMLASRSTDGGRTWSKPAVLVSDTLDRFNDKNTITADPTDARFVYTAWDRLSSIPGEGAGPALFARSVNNGVSWEPAKIIFDPGPTAQTIGNRIEVLPNGGLVNLLTRIDFVAQAATVEVILSNDKGATWSAPVKVADLLTVGTADPETGTPVRDGGILPQLAIAMAGPYKGRIYVVWQDARFSGGARDGIALSTSDDGGLTWSAPVQINQDPLAPAFIASIHVRRDGTVGVTYHDLRSNTADPTTLLTDTWLTRSRDGGLTWRESRVSKPFDLAKAPFAGGLFVGDYQSLVSIGPVFIPFFAKSTAGADTSNRTDVFSHFALSSLLSGAARGSTSVTRQVEQEEAALPAMSVQGTGRATPAVVSGAWRERGMQAAQNHLRQNVPNWDQRFAPRWQVQR
jgi:BNR/Asp-box repeat